MYQNDKSSDSKVKFRQAINCWKRVLEAAKLAYADETKESINPQKLGSCDFWEIAKVFSTKVDQRYLLNLATRRCCPLHLIKQNCLLKTFVRTLILTTQVSLYLFSELFYILAELFNKCLKESCFPGCWKVSSVVPVFKNVRERSTAKNYFLVSLLAEVSLKKVFEKLVNNRIVDHLENLGLCSDFQYICF